MLVSIYRQMTIKATMFGVLVTACALIAAIAATSITVRAEDTTVNQSTNVLKVSPLRSDITIEPGKSDTVQVIVSNLTDQPISIRAIANDFVAGDERGGPALILDDKEFAPTHSLKRFMQPISDVTIPAGKSSEVTVEIKVPADTQAGGYFGAVRFAPRALNEGGQVNMSASAASLILLTVPGDLVEKLELTNFEVLNNGNAAGKYMFNPGSIETTVRFESKGNVQVAPLGKITVLRDGKIVHETDFNNEQPRDMVLPDSARRWDVSLGGMDSFGKYTVKATLTYGATNQTVEVAKTFWVIPTAVLIGGIVGLIALLGLIGVIWLLVHKKRGNRPGAKTQLNSRR